MSEETAKRRWHYVTVDGGRYDSVKPQCRNEPVVVGKGRESGGQLQSLILNIE